jgi:hypothetical protein
MQCRPPPSSSIVVEIEVGKMMMLSKIFCVLLFSLIFTRYEFKRGFATGCFGHRVFLVTHDAVKYSNGH